MKSTMQRDIYAEALAAYQAQIPIEQWPTQNGMLSKSGLERVMRTRGFPRFERKRFDSSKCRPLIMEMNQALSAQLARSQPSNDDRNDGGKSHGATNIEIRLLERRIEQLENELKSVEGREKRYRERCRLLEAEVESTRSQHDAFERHCMRDLRTLHV